MNMVRRRPLVLALSQLRGPSWRGYAARFALVIHFARWADDDPTLTDPMVIDEQSIGSGIRLSLWFGHEARRFYATLDESQETYHQKQFVSLIQRQNGSITVREWQRKRSHKTSADARTELQELVDAGFGSFETPPPPLKGGRPSERFVLTGQSDAIGSRPACSEISGTTENEADD